MALIETSGLYKIYDVGDAAVHALDGVDVKIERGEFVAIMGPSGSGKSTFMNLIGCLDKPSRGSYRLDGHEVGELDRDELAHIRNQKLGFVFQGFNLLARSTALENVELPMIYTATPAKERHERAIEALRELNLEQRMHHRPAQLSGGQQQRVAIARALVNRAPVLLADEPTGNLDTKTSHEIMDLFVKLNRERGISIVLVTHEADVAAYAKRTIHFLDGRIISDEVNV